MQGWGVGGGGVIAEYHAMAGGGGCRMVVPPSPQTEWHQRENHSQLAQSHGLGQQKSCTFSTLLEMFIFLLRLLFSVWNASNVADLN